MSSFTRKVLLDTHSPLLQFQRFRGKINVQKPRKPHYDRALFNAVTQPYIPIPTVTELCYEYRQKLTIYPVKTRGQFIAEKSAIPTTKLITTTSTTTSANPYERIIAREVKNLFDHSKLIAIFHVNSISSEDWFKARVAFHKQNMQLKVYGKTIMKQANGDTEFRTILPLFDAKNCIVFSSEQKIPQLLKICKKIPQMLLLAGIVENRLLSKTELTEFVKMPSLEMARAQLVAVLQNAGGNQILSQLQQHQSNLCYSLDAYSKPTPQEGNEKSTVEVSTGTENETTK